MKRICWWVMGMAMLLTANGVRPIPVKAEDSRAHLENVQRLLTGKIARIVDVSWTGDPATSQPFIKAVQGYAARGYRIYNLSGANSAYDAAGYAGWLQETMKAVDTYSGRQDNLFMPQMNYAGRDPSVQDRLYTGEVIHNSTIVCPNYAFVDVSDTTQTNKVVNFIRQTAENLKSTPYYNRVIGYLPVWGMWGENGMYVGGAGCTSDELKTDYGYLINSAGYSGTMLNGFKQFYGEKKAAGIIPAISGVDNLVNGIDSNNRGTWPVPSEDGNKQKMMAYFLMYRKSLVKTFNGQIVAALRSVSEERATASFCYLPLSAGAQYATGWADVPGVDFCITQTGTAGYGTKRTLLEADCVGGNDFAGNSNGCSKTDGNWFEQETKRTIQRGGNVMAFNRQEYWSAAIDGVTRGLDARTSLWNSQLPYSTAKVAFLVPTYSRALRSPLSGMQFGLDKLLHNLEVISWLNGLSVNYDLISEDELFDLDGLRKYNVIIIHDQNLFSGMFPSQWQAFLGRYAGVAVGDNNGSLSRTDVENAVRNRVLNTTDACATVCASNSIEYLRNTNCKKTCPVAVSEMPAVPTAVPVPPTATLTPTSLRVRGDANGDRVVDMMDFVIWKKEFTGVSMTKMADYSGDGKVGMEDFGIWKKTFMGM